MTMTDTDKIDAFMDRLDAALTLNDEEADDALRETRSHLVERSESGRLDQALTALGTPEGYAAGFNEGAGSAADARTPSLVAIVARLLLCSLALAVALFLSFMVAAELMDPGPVGLWLSEGEGFFVFGRYSGSDPAVYDALGWALAPLGATIVGILLFIVRREIKAILAGVQS